MWVSSSVTTLSMSRPVADGCATACLDHLSRIEAWIQIKAVSHDDTSPANSSSPSMTVRMVPKLLDGLCSA